MSANRHNVRAVFHLAKLGLSLCDLRIPHTQPKVFWNDVVFIGDYLPTFWIICQRFRGTCCPHLQGSLLWPLCVL